MQHRFAWLQIPSQTFGEFIVALCNKFCKRKLYNYFKKSDFLLCYNRLAAEYNENLPDRCTMIAQQALRAKTVSVHIPDAVRIYSSRYFRMSAVITSSEVTGASDNSER